MATKLVKCKITIGTKAYYFLGPKGLYTGGVATGTGITEADEVTEADEPVLAVKEILGSGVGKRISVRSSSGTTRFTTKMLAAKDKIATVEEAITGDTIKTEGTKSNGSAIVSVVEPRRATFY